ncbi:MAG: DUF4846 domain-containing protein [Bacteroidales bacterium]|nr:DUF4846 domain-containing protein [Bacteroidales bacterium]
MTRFAAFTLPLLLLFIFSCKAQNNPPETLPEVSPDKYRICIPEGMTTAGRFNPLEGYSRIEIAEGSFGNFLRNLTLKPFGEKVRYYDGSIKQPGNVYLSVIDLEIGNRDLQQCADAVMRLRAEYLYELKDYNSIHFNFISDGKPRYFTDYAGEDLSYPKFRKYLDFVFSYANTASLHDELLPVADPSAILPGDVFIQKRNPFGHAVIVLDVAADTLTGERIFMLAQSYMPAQEIQVLVNPSEPEISPWYRLTETLLTPEWTFQLSDLRRFTQNR